MKIVVPATLLIIFALLYATFRRWDEAALIMATLPFALTGGVWLLYLLGFNQSVATGVGFIALAARIGRIWGCHADLPQVGAGGEQRR